MTGVGVREHIRSARDIQADSLGGVTKAGKGPGQRDGGMWQQGAWTRWQHVMDKKIIQCSFFMQSIFYGACSRKKKEGNNTIRKLKGNLKQRYKKLKHKLARDLRYNNTLRIYLSVTPRQYHLRSDLVTVTHSTKSMIL